MIKGLTESKIEDYDNASWAIIRRRFFQAILHSGFDYRIDLMFCERVVAKQRKIMNGFNLIAAMENDKYACNGESKHNKLTNNVWIGDMGALCHMWSSLKGITTQLPDWEASKSVAAKS